MTLLPSGVKMHVALGVTDMRKGLDGLAMLVQGTLRHCHVNSVHSRQGAGDRARHPVAAVAAFHTSIASRRTRRRVGRLIR
jgi:hypothetical protein